MKARLLSFLLLGVLGCNSYSAGPSPKGRKLRPVDADGAAGAAVPQPRPQTPPAEDPLALLGDPTQAQLPTPNSTFDSEGLPIGSSPVLGPNDALVTIVEFSDLQCPYCDKGRQVAKQIKEKYGDQVRIAWKNLPLIEIHPNALPGAVALMALQRQGAEVFWAAEEMLFDTQATWGGRGAQQISPALFERYLEAVPGINLEQWRSDLKDPQLGKAIVADMKLAEYVSISSTPTFFVNGRKLEGAYPLEEFSRIIDAEILAAKAELARGTAIEKIYAERIKKNLITADTRFKVEAIGPSKGPQDAKVTVVVFSDYQCPYCEKGENNLNKALQNQSDVRVVYRNLPLDFHPDAFPAAEAALAAHEQGKFNEYHQKLFEGQKALSREDLERYAQELQLDMARFTAALDSHKFKEIIEQDMSVAAAMGINGTPAYYINGKLLHGAYPAEAFSEVITKEIALADEMLKKGVPKAKLYEEFMKEAYVQQ